MEKLGDVIVDAASLLFWNIGINWPSQSLLDGVKVRFMAHPRILFPLAGQLVDVSGKFPQPMPDFETLPSKVRSASPWWGTP